MSMLSRLLLIPLTIFSLAHIASAASSDARFMIDVTPNAQQDATVQQLHNNVRGAAKLALPRLWHRIVPQHAHSQIPKKVKAVRFLQRATPTAEGVSITFHAKRVFSWLKKNNVPYIEKRPEWNLELQLINAKGREMKQSAAMLQRYAAASSRYFGYELNNSATSLVLHWQWQNSRQVLLTVRGTSVLGEFSEMRKISSGDPVKQLRPWLTEIMLKARDGQTASTAATSMGSQELPGDRTQTALPAAKDIFLLLSIERHASLPEQVLFEEELKRDPRILNLHLSQVNRENQQYRLQLKGSDDQWLVEWFKRRGLTLTANIEGWVAR